MAEKHRFAASQESDPDPLTAVLIQRALQSQPMSMPQPVIAPSLSPNASNRWSDINGPAWPTDSEYDNPTPQFLARATQGPIGNIDQARAAIQRKFTGDESTYGAIVDRAEKLRRSLHNQKYPAK